MLDIPFDSRTYVLFKNGLTIFCSDQTDTFTDSGSKTSIVSKKYLNFSEPDRPKPSLVNSGNEMDRLSYLELIP